MKKLTQKSKNQIINASLFVLGVIVTIIFTKFSDILIPNNPVIVKEVSDTIKIIHNYNFPENLNNDSTRLELEKKIKNLELLNSYDKQINERLKSIKNKKEITPNLIIIKDLGELTKKGYLQESSSSYFTSDCPNLNSEFVDIKIDFFNPEIYKEIAYLRVNINRYDIRDSKETRTWFLEEFYEVKPIDNFIRMSNDFGKGKYEILYGFIFKKDLQNKYASYHLKRCVCVKE